MHPASSPVIVTEEAEVGEALGRLGLTIEIVRRVAIAAASARAESLPVDPAGAAGQLSYIHGVRAMRLDLLSIGWDESRAGNVESMVNHLIGVQVCFQNVDRACKPSPPLAISEKGPASRRLVNSGQLELFASSSEASSYLRGRNPAVWYICVSVDTHGVFAEVSCPKPFDGNQFDGFVKRLFVVSESLEPKPASRSDDDDDDLDFDVAVSKK